MLGLNGYSPVYVDECRRKIQDLILSYRNMILTARKQAMRDDVQLISAINIFEVNLFNNMIVALDAYFCHHPIDSDGSEKSPLNEVRLISLAILHHNSKLTSDRTIRYNPEDSVLKYKMGNEIRLTEWEFSLLSTAFFTELESRSGQMKSLR